MRANDLPVLPEGFAYRLDLRQHVTPRLLRDQPIHRWFWFPHSFSPQLIDEILRAFPISSAGRILDPFVGAGTTVLRALELGYAADGNDLSPLSLFVSRVKLASYDRAMLEASLEAVLERYRPIRDDGEHTERIRQAFTPEELAHLNGLRHQIDALPQPAADFFRLVLLRVQQSLSRARPDGGWFRWVEREDQSQFIRERFLQQARLHLADVASAARPPAQILCSDARQPDGLQGQYDLIITSPPYPNRHDYSRVFHIELLSLGIPENEIKNFRYGSIRSHVEAKEPPLNTNDYTPPPGLLALLDRLPADADPRVRPLLSGYFEDMYLTLRSLRQHLKPEAICAFVVGNVRHAGLMVPVDEILAEVGQNAGYNFIATWVARLRGNSAQQMGRFGIEPARESIVFLRMANNG
ncbi:MAG: DNA adenine methylase [Chloroflexi bacterium]|nr:DNA adenine methylase [Chloroflexota bacterium]